jgi:hypothetical protein
MAGLADVRHGRSIFDHREVFRDEKYDLWSIIKLDWDYPPYLRELDDRTPDTKVRATPILRGEGIGFTVEMNPRQQEGGPITGADYRLYVERDSQTCDSSPKYLFQYANTSAELLLPKNFKGCVQISVAPRTATKTGSKYYTDIIVIGDEATAKAVVPFQQNAR